MTFATPVRLGDAENTLIEQLRTAGADVFADRVSARGFPTRKVEAFHYTDLKSLLTSVPQISPDGSVEAGSPDLRLAGAYRTLVVNGVANPVGTPPNGIEIKERASAVFDDGHDFLLNINSALSGHGLDVNLTGSVDPVVHLDHRVLGAARHVCGANQINVASGATATVLESVSTSAEEHLSNIGTKLVLGDNAHLLHVVVQQAHDTARHFHTVDYELGENAKLTTLHINLGAKLSRTQVYARFVGGGAHADFSGLSLLDDGQHCDVTLDVTHAVPNTTSKELFKSVVRGESLAVFQGRIVVVKDAQKTDAKMMSQGLMLSPNAQILVKPELEIFADDVQCGHGATCGDLDEDTLFYLMSRGIPKDEATSMLTRAFMQELVDQVEDAEFNEALNGIVDAWLDAGANA